MDLQAEGLRAGSQAFSLRGNSHCEPRATPWAEGSQAFGLKTHHRRTRNDWDRVDAPPWGRFPTYGTLAGWKPAPRRRSNRTWYQSPDHRGRPVRGERPEQVGHAPRLPRLTRTQEPDAAGLEPVAGSLGVGPVRRRYANDALARGGSGHERRKASEPVVRGAPRPPRGGRSARRGRRRAGRTPRPGRGTRGATRRRRRSGRPPGTTPARSAPASPAARAGAPG